MATPVFNPDEPFEEVAVPRFDPSQAFEEIPAPRFDPSKPFEEVADSRTQPVSSVTQMADATRATVGVIGRTIAARNFAVAGYDAPDRSQLEDGYQPDESALAPIPGNIEPKPVHALPALASNLGNALTKTLPFPRVTAQEVTDAFSMLASMSPDLTEEESQAVIENTMKPGNLEKIVAGAQRAAITVPESFTSIFGAATMGTGALGVTAGRVVAGGFSAHMANQMPQQVTALKDAIASGDAERITEASGNLLATGAMVAATGKHALTGKPNPAKVVGDALMKSIEESRAIEAQPALVELAQRAPLTAKAVTEANVAARGRNALEPTPEFKPFDILANGLPPLSEPIPSATPLTAEAVKAVVKPVPEAPTQAEPELIGMGGAIPAEFEPGRGTATGIKNAKVDEERQSRGQPPMLKSQRIGNEVVWDRTMARIDTEPGWQDRLIDELKEKPRTPSADEIVALDHRYVDLQNEYAKATRDGAEHYKDNYAEGVADAKARTDFIEGKLAELEQVARNVGAEWGRSGQMRQRLLNEDFTLAAMEARARAAKGFEPLTEAEHADIADLHAKIAEAEKKAVEVEAASSERIALLEAQKALAEARAATTQQPLYEPRVLQAAEKFAKFMDKKGEAALARIKARLGQTSAGVDPTILSDVAILGAAKITRGAVDFAKWTEVMTRDLGEWFREHAQAAWDASQQVFNAENNTYHKGDKATVSKVRRAAADIAGRLADTKAAIEVKASGEGSPLHGEVRKLVRLLVEQDRTINRDQLIDAVHAILKESVPGITRLETMDAVSGRGKFWTPDQGEVSKTVRDLSTQIRLVGHQIDVEAGRPLPRTGYQPEKLSDAARHEQQILNELKRRHGVVVTDPAAQLASALTVRKVYYAHRIADLKAEIASRERTVKNRSLPPTDPALESLKSEYKTVKAEHDEIFGKKELTDAQRLKLALVAAERNEASWNERLADAKKGVFDRKEPARKVTSAELEAIKARTEAVKEEVQELKDIAFPKKTPDQIALQSLKARLAREKAHLIERLATGDFSPLRKPARELPLDDAAATAKAEVTLLREQFQQRLERHKYELKTRAEKAWIGSKEALNLSRAILTSWDVSAVFRQGGFIAFGNPVRAARALGPMFDALRSEKRAAAIEAQILSRPNAPLYAQSKLFLAPREGAKLSAMEEAFMSRLASKIPGVASSQRAYITFLNKLRADTFDSLHESLVSKRSATPEELSAISNYINVATGRGNLGKAAVAAETLSTVFFAPRLVASRFQILAGQPLYRGTMRTRLLIAREYGKFAVGLATVYGLGMLAGASVETDPRSSDFGKLLFGATRVDPMGGLAQVTVLTSRLATGQKTNLRGKTEAIRGKVPYGKDTSADVIARFMRTKLSPIVGSSVDVLSGSNVVGEPVTPGSAAVNAVMPLAFRDIYDVMLEQGIPAGTAISILSLLGMGVQNYQDRSKK